MVQIHRPDRSIPALPMIYAAISTAPACRIFGTFSPPTIETVTWREKMSLPSETRRASKSNSPVTHALIRPMVLAPSKSAAGKYSALSRISTSETAEPARERCFERYHDAISATVSGYSVNSVSPLLCFLTRGIRQHSSYPTPDTAHQVPPHIELGGNHARELAAMRFLNNVVKARHFRISSSDKQFLWDQWRESDGLAALCCG